MRRSTTILCALLLLFAGVVSAEETAADNLDSLFDEPATDIVEKQPASAPTANHLDAFNKTDKAVFTGNFEAAGGLVFGWKEFPDPADPWKTWDPSLLANATTTLNLDARPDPDFRLFGSFTASMAPSKGSFSWSGLTISELFCDYTLFNSAFIRFGQHTITWGQGRLYVPGNLMSDSATGTALRVSFPTILSGISLIALAQNSFFTTPTTPYFKEVAYGAITDIVFAGVRASAGVRYRGHGNSPEGLRLLGSLKTTVLKTDFLCDFVYRDNFDNPSWTVLGGFYREWEDVKIYGEYQYDGNRDGLLGKKAGLALGINNIFGSGVDIGCKWLHSFSAAWGGFVIGVTFSPWKYLKATFAVPVIYGDTGPYDILNDANVTTVSYVVTQRLSLVMLLKLSAPF